MLTTRKAFVLLLGGAGLIGCNDQPNRSLTAPARPAVSAALEADRVESDKNHQKAWGHADFIVTNEGNPEEWYVFDAKAAKDDAAANPLFTLARGDLAYGLAEKGGFVILGDMYCFKIVGNRANLAARVEKSTNPNVHRGDYLTWRIEDNGNGERRPADRTTQLFLLKTQADAESFCAFGGDATHPFFPVKGNLEIKDQ